MAGMKQKIVLPLSPGGPGIPGSYLINFDPALNQGNRMFKNIPQGSLLHMHELLTEDEHGRLCKPVCCTRLYIAGCKDDVCGCPVIMEVPLQLPVPIVKVGVDPEPDGATTIYFEKIVDIKTD